MGIILDTCALLALVGLTEKRLSKKTLACIRTADQVFVSSCTMFEIAVKHKKRGLDLDSFRNPAQLWNVAVSKYELTELPVSHDIFYDSVLLPDHHTDPFDRIIIAHARREQVPVATFDSVFQSYDVTILN
jgi:PIN domain nuclease of toxin-antitoxin system